MLGGADNPNGELPSYITGANTGNGSVEKSGSGTLTVSNTTLTQKAVNLNEGTLTLN
ncbi:hypothetical protein F3170_26530, partial [Escherichia coli]|nr:hypothetical protein [Escherichia coli]